MKRNKQRRFRVDRIFTGVGRICMESGARTRAEHTKRDAVLTELADTGRLDILRAIKAGRVTINEVFAAQRAGRLGFVASDMILARNLWEAVGLDADGLPTGSGWLRSAAKAPATRTRYAGAWRSLQRAGALGNGAQTRDLAAVNWIGLRNRWSTGPTGWNHMRRAVSRFLSMSLKKTHPFRLEVMDPDTFPAEQEPEGRVPDLSPDLFWRIVHRTPECLWPAYVTMAAGGLGPKEYLACREEHLMPHTTALQVPGSKVGRKGFGVVNFDPAAWAWVTQAIPSPVTYRPLYDAWKRAAAAEGSPELRLYDLRHVYGQWLSDSGQPEARIQVGLRHKTAALTRRYTKQKDKGENAKVIASIMFPTTSSDTAASQ